MVMAALMVTGNAVAGTRVETLTHQNRDSLHLIHLPLVTHHLKPYHLQHPETLAFAPSVEGGRKERESPAKPETATATVVAGWDRTYSRSEEG